MKKLILFILLMILFSTNNTTFAQQYYHFVYVEHEIGDHKNVLCERLKELYKDTKKTDDVLIIYLSTGNREQNYGLCSYLNINDPLEKQQDTEEAFNSIIAIIQDSKSLPVIAQADVKNIREIMDALNFVDENRAIKYRKAEIDFYVGSQFWKSGFNNSIIAHLYSILGISTMPQNVVSFRVFVPRTDDKLKYSDGMPFGDNNIDGINERIKIQKY